MKIGLSMTTSLASAMRGFAVVSAVILLLCGYANGQQEEYSYYNTRGAALTAAGPASYGSGGSVGSGAAAAAGGGHNQQQQQQQQGASALSRRDEFYITVFVVDVCSACLDANPVNPHNCDMVCLPLTGPLGPSCSMCMYDNTGDTSACDMECCFTDPDTPDMTMDIGGDVDVGMGGGDLDTSALTPCTACILENKPRTSVCETTCINELTSVETTPCTECLINSPNRPNNCVSECSSFTMTPCMECIVENKRNPSNCLTTCDMNAISINMYAKKQARKNGEEQVEVPSRYGSEGPGGPGGGLPHMGEKTPCKECLFWNSDRPSACEACCPCETCYIANFPDLTPCESYCPMDIPPY